VLPEWLDVLRDGGRLLVPLTAAIPGMMANIGKGMVLAAERHSDAWSAKLGSMIAIYSLVGLRDDARAQQLGQLFMGANFMRVRRLRRDPHEPGPDCVLHGDVCLSA
jgi:hypothetical protein